MATAAVPPGASARRLLDLITAARGKRVVVLGDLIADEFVSGRISRVSREAPVLILEYDNTEIVPGGAGNAAHNVATLGGAVTLVALAGRDEPGRRVLASFPSRVDRRAISRPAGYHTPVKTRILAGEVLWCQGFSEPGSWSDLASLRTSAVVDGDHLVVNGQKIWSSYADIAEYQELLIRTTPGSQRHKGLSWVVCDMRTPGITVRPIRNMAGATHFAEVFYDNVRIPLSNVVGTLGDGWNVAMQTLGFERGTAATALQLGLSAKVEKLAELAAQADLATSCGTVQQDATLLPRLAVLRAQAAALRAMTYQTLFRDADTPFGGSLVRLYFAELSQQVHRLGMDLLGPAAIDTHALGGWPHDYLESYSETIAGGTAEIQRNIIGERILGLPREGSR